MVAAANDNVDSFSVTGFYVKDEISGDELLVDTGAFCSIYPATSLEKAHNDPDALTMVAANGSRITTHGYRTIPLKFFGRKYEWRFILANVRQPLLGADFLGHNKLLVDVSQKRLIDMESCSFFPLLLADRQTINACSPRASGIYSCLFDEFPQVFRGELKQVPGTAPKHGVVHHIKTNGPPVLECGEDGPIPDSRHLLSAFEIASPVGRRTGDNFSCRHGCATTKSGERKARKAKLEQLIFAAVSSFQPRMKSALINLV